MSPKICSGARDSREARRNDVPHLNLAEPLFLSSYDRSRLVGALMNGGGSMHAAVTIAIWIVKGGGGIIRAIGIMARHSSQGGPVSQGLYTVTRR